MSTRNINLTDHYDQFVEEQIASGQFKNASEVMRAGLRLLEQQRKEDQAKLAAKAFNQLDQGQGIALEGEEQLKGFISQLGRRAGRGAASDEST